jgi:cytidine deaminase
MGALPDDLAELLARARAAADAAYVPYSGFRVGAALGFADGTVVTGCNVENASYGLTLCAERNACTTAVAHGLRAFDAVAIYVDGPDGQPCGACRQFLHEFAPDAQVVYLRAGEPVVTTLRELLPDGFERESLDA